MTHKVGPRRRSREMALQILYAMEVGELPPDEAIFLYYMIFHNDEDLDFKEDEDLDFEVPMAARPFAEEIVQGVEAHQNDIDRLIGSASQHWRLERMSLVDRNILRIALYEMMYRSDIPPKVSINEAIDMGKTFGTQDSGSFINGILDHLLLEIEKQKEASSSATSQHPA